MDAVVQRQRLVRSHRRRECVSRHPRARIVGGVGLHEEPIDAVRDGDRGFPLPLGERAGGSYLQRTLVDGCSSRSDLRGAARRCAQHDDGRDAEHAHHTMLSDGRVVRFEGHHGVGVLD